MMLFSFVWLSSWVAIESVPRLLSRRRYDSPPVDGRRGGFGRRHCEIRRNRPPDCPGVHRRARVRPVSIRVPARTPQSCRTADFGLQVELRCATQILLKVGQQLRARRLRPHATELAMRHIFHPGEIRFAREGFFSVVAGSWACRLILLAAVVGARLVRP